VNICRRMAGACITVFVVTKVYLQGGRRMQTLDVTEIYTPVILHLYFVVTLRACFVSSRRYLSCRLCVSITSPMYRNRSPWQS
jgi:hypothetical protein